MLNANMFKQNHKTMKKSGLLCSQRESPTVIFLKKAEKDNALEDGD